MQIKMRRQTKIGLIVGAGLISMLFGPTKAVLANDGSACVPGSATMSPVAAINIGGPQVVVNGRTWTADPGAAGWTWTNPSAMDIAGTEDDAIYRSERAGNFTYNVAVPAAGDYLVRLHAAEIWWNSPNGQVGSTSRVQNVNLEGGSIDLPNFNVGAEAGGPMIAVVRGFEKKVTDGYLTVDVATVSDAAKLNALEVLRINRCGGTTATTVAPTTTKAPVTTVAPTTTKAPVTTVAPTTTKPPAPPTTLVNRGPVARFAANSPWYSDVRNAPLASNSSAITANLVKQASNPGALPVINTTSYAPPIYVTNASTPRVNINFDNCQNKTWIDPVFLEQMKNVPIPAHAVPANGTDKEVVFYSPQEDTLWELWVATKTDGRWSACWGGKMTNVSSSNGTFQQWYGVTAAGLSLYAGTIRVEELRAGYIDHAMGIAMQHTASWPNISWPANRTDGWNPTNDPSVPTQGQRLRLDPTVNVEALNIHPVAKTIARAAQKHGFIVWDTAGAISLRAENPLGYTSAGQADPYPQLMAGSQWGWNTMAGFPWDKVQALPLNYGKP